MRKQQTVPLLQWRTLTPQSPRKIVSSTGRQYSERSRSIYGRGWNIEIVVELEEALGDFTQRAITADNNDELSARIKGDACLRRCAALTFGEVDLVIDACGVELNLNSRPRLSRLSRDIVDDDQHLPAISGALAGVAGFL